MPPCQCDWRRPRPRVSSNRDAAGNTTARLTGGAGLVRAPIPLAESSGGERSPRSKLRSAHLGETSANALSSHLNDLLPSAHLEGSAETTGNRGAWSVLPGRLRTRSQMCRPTSCANSLSLWCLRADHLLPSLVARSSQILRVR
jgi:hypothetical protein